MDTAVINLKVDPITKRRAQSLADELGLSLSGLIKAYLKQIVRTKSVSYSASDEEPTEYLIQSLRASAGDIKEGRISPMFSDAKGAISWLNHPKKRHAGRVH